MEVRIGRIPGRISTVALEEGATVSDAVSVAGLEVESGFAPRINGEDVSMDTAVSDGQTVLLCRRVKGNQS